MDISWIAALLVVACGALIGRFGRPILSRLLPTLQVRPALPFWLLFLCALFVCGALLLFDREMEARAVAMTAFVTFAAAVAADVYDSVTSRTPTEHND